MNEQDGWREMRTECSLNPRPALQQFVFLLAPSAVAVRKPPNNSAHPHWLPGQAHAAVSAVPSSNLRYSAGDVASIISPSAALPLCLSSPLSDLWLAIAIRSRCVSRGLRKKSCECDSMRHNPCATHHECYRVVVMF
jgi:hypothetical protein